MNEILADNCKTTSMRIKEKLEPRYFVAVALCFLLIFQAANPIIPVNAQPTKSLVIEGKHIRFFLQEETSNFVPTVSINSKWLDIDVKMDGRVTKGEWTDAQALTLLPNIGPNLGNFNGTVHIKNNKESLFIAIDVRDDKTQDAKGDWAEVSFVNNGPMKQNSSSVVYHVEAIEKSTLVKYSVMKDGKNLSTSDISRSISPIRSQGSAFFDNNRMYELKVSLTDPSLKRDSSGILHMKLLINDASSGKKCQYCAWEIGVASSKDKPGSAMNFKQMVTQKVIPLLDSAYENFLVLTKSAPYNGATIDMKFSADSKASRFGNPVVVDARKFLPHLASNNLPDTYLYSFVHQLAHNFVPARSPLSLETPISSAFADLMTYEFFKQIKIPYSDWYGPNILKKYENDKSPFANLNWSGEHRSKDPYPTDALMYGIFKQILQKYGSKLFAKVATIELNSTPPDTETRISLLVHMLSKSAGKDLAPDFKDKWNFPITPSTLLFDFELQNMDNIEIVQGVSLSREINVSLTKWFPHAVSLSVKGLPQGAKATLDPAKGDPPFQSKLNLTTSLNTKVGSYPITIIAVGSSKNHTLSFMLDVIRITDLIKIDLKADKLVGPLGGQFKFSASIKSNQTSSMTNKLGLFIDNKFVTAQNFTLGSKSKSLDFIWESKGIDTKVLHTAQIKIMSGDKAIRESNKIKFGVFEAVKKTTSQSKNIVITEPTARDPDTKKNYTLAHVGSIKALLKAKGNYDLNIVAPDGKVIIGKGGLINSPDRIQTTFDIKNIKIKLMYTGSKARNELLTVKPVEENKPLPSGQWKIIVVENVKGFFKVVYDVKYVPAPELSKGFKS